MKFLYFTLLGLLACCLPSSAQRFHDYFDPENYNHTLTYDGFKAVFHLQSPGKSPGAIESGVKYAWFSGNKIAWTQGGYSGKLLDGPYTEFYQNKTLKTKGSFDMGLRKGEWRSWTEQGVLDSVVNYSNGVLNGYFERYNLDGSPKESGKYRKGLLDGKLERHISKDSVQVLKYDKGKISLQRPSKIKAWIKRFFKKHKKQQDKQNGQR